MGLSVEDGGGGDMGFFYFPDALVQVLWAGNIVRTAGPAPRQTEEILRGVCVQGKELQVR